MTIFSQTVTLDFGCLGEHDVEVSYAYSPGRPGKMYLRNGDPGYPDEPAELEILSVPLYSLDTLPYLPETTLDLVVDTLDFLFTNGGVGEPCYFNFTRPDFSPVS